MAQGERRIPTVALSWVWVMALLAAVRPSHAVMNQTTECLAGFAGVPAGDENGGTVTCTDCDPTCDTDGANNGSCTFTLSACANQASGSCTATALQSVKVKGKCGARALSFRPSGTAATCGSEQHLVVKLKKKGRRAGKCKIVAQTRSAAKPRRVDRDTLKLVCMPRPAGEACPTTTTTTTLPCAPAGTSMTTSTLPCAPPTPGASSCTPIVTGQPIAGSYRLQGTAGEKRCTTNAAANRFGTCSTDADCGGTVGACLILPWVTADGQIMPFPTGSQTTFTVNEAGAEPACEHTLCIPCGNPNAPCAGLPGCEVPCNPNGCVPRGTQGCCDQPGFIVPTFFVDILGGLCSRVDQIACGLGVVNTSNPQTGDNEVNKEADTSDPGPDCTYGTADDPAGLVCNISGEGSDYKGKIVRTIGDGNPDAAGIHFRLTTPEISTTWADAQSDPGSCADGSTFDDGELLVSQIVIKSEPTTAGASGSFVDMNGDGCKRAGAGFINNSSPDTDGPIVAGPAPAGPARPQSYDGSSGPVTATVSEVFTGPNSPIRDLGFVSITPYLPAIVVPAQSCCCTETPGCPE